MARNKVPYTPMIQTTYYERTKDGLKPSLVAGIGVPYLEDATEPEHELWWCPVYISWDSFGPIPIPGGDTIHATANAIKFLISELEDNGDRIFYANGEAYRPRRNLLQRAWDRFVVYPRELRRARKEQRRIFEQSKTAD